MSMNIAQAREDEYIFAFPQRFPRKLRLMIKHTGVVHAEITICRTFLKEKTPAAFSPVIGECTDRNEGDN